MTFTVRVSLFVRPPFGPFYEERERTVDIPPEYDLEERRRLYAFHLEALTDQALKDLGWFNPRQHALFANAARLVRIEHLIDGDTSPLANQIRAVIEAGSQEAIDKWGEPPIENFELDNEVDEE